MLEERCVQMKFVCEKNIGHFSHLSIGFILSIYGVLLVESSHSFVFENILRE